MNKKELFALISLLEDPDNNIYSHVKNRLIEFGVDSIPFLEQAWEVNFDSLIQKRSENIIQIILFNQTNLLLSNWLKTNEKDLLDAWLIISKHQYPDLNEKLIKNKISELVSKINMEIKDCTKSIEKVMKINKVLFKYEKFRGNFKNYHSPENSFINNVLNSKKGNPLSLSLLYIIIAQNLNLPIKGVNLPKHFIIAYTSEDLIDIDPIEFYINPFSLGAIINRKDVESFLKKENIEAKSIFFDVCGNKEILRRIIINLLYSFTKQGKKEKADEMIQFLQLFR